MPALSIAVAVLAVLVAGAALYRLHRVRRALIAERAARRLMAPLQARDMRALADRLTEAAYANQVLSEAEQVLDTALATHHSNPEGGHP
ncbi:hypothetical protein [Streptomyces griseorubiginosus]|uniref:hypothetical protein n=1 Tax=Streptomyces griseorubiginosus TaxID=67304 RepID=UPI00332D4422